jgi:hypothetical protein
MRTTVTISIGIAIWAASLVLARRYGKAGGTAVEDTTLAFITIWFLISATALWAAVAKAGYTFRDELPGCLMSFGIPAAVAALVRWRFFPPRADAQ